MEVISRKMLKPALPSKHAILQLSNMDQVQFPSHMPTVFLYPNNGSPEFMSTKVLQASLEKLLVEFFPLAGRLQPLKDGRLCVVCNDEGIEFTEVSASDEFDFQDFQPRPIMEFLDPTKRWQKEGKSHNEMPITLVQVTRFNCGGVVMVTATSHKVTDAMSFEHFIRRWSNVAKGDRANDLNDPICFTHPKLSSNLPAVPLEMPPYKVTMNFKYAEELCGGKLYKFEGSKIKMLQQSVISASGNKYTKFEVLGSHIWHSIAKAKSFQPTSTSKVVFSVNGRRRFKPQLPDHLFCNVIFSAVATTKGVQDLATGAKLIHDAAKSVDESFMRSCIDKVQMGDIGSVELGPNDISLTSWQYNQLYEADFGFGKPTFVGYCTTGKGNWPVASAFLMPDMDPEVIWVLIMGLKEDEMKKLEL